MLGWVEVDEPVEVLSLVGLAFLLFLAGLEIDLAALRGRAAARGLARLRGLARRSRWSPGSLLDLAGIADEPLLIAIILASTSLGVIVPVLQDRARSRRGSASW